MGLSLCCPSINALIKVFQQLQDKLVALRQRCTGAEPSCSILQELTVGQPHVSQDSDSHVGHSH